MNFSARFRVDYVLFFLEKRVPIYLLLSHFFSFQVWSMSFKLIKHQDENSYANFAGYMLIPAMQDLERFT